MNFNHYQLYGLIIQTKNSISHLIEVTNFKQVDVAISFKAQETNKEYSFSHLPTEIYKSNGLAANAIPYLTIWKQYEASEFLIIRYTNGQETAFFISDKKGEQVKVFYHPTIPINDIYTYFLGPVIGCILRLKHQVCLHASVVNINQQAIAFIGAKTAGKSTLIATLAAKGYPVLSDDIAVLFEKNNTLQVSSGYPRLRLWRQSLAAIESINIENLDPVLAHIDKYYLPLNGKEKQAWHFQKKPLPLQAVVYLNNRNEQQYLALNRITLLDAFLKLKQNIYADYMLEESLLKKEFDLFGRISREIPVLSLERPDDLQYLEETCKTIADWTLNN